MNYMHKKLPWPFYLAFLGVIDGIATVTGAIIMDTEIYRIGFWTAISLTFVLTNLAYGIYDLVKSDKKVVCAGPESMMVFLLALVVVCSFSCYVFYELKNYLMLAFILATTIYFIVVVTTKELILPKMNENTLRVSNENYKRAYDNFSADILRSFSSIYSAERAYRDCLQVIDLLGTIDGCQEDADKFREKLEDVARNYSHEQASIAVDKIKLLMPEAQKPFNDPLASNEVKYGILELARVFCENYQADAEHATRNIKSIQLDAYKMALEKKKLGGSFTDDEDKSE